MQIPLFFARLRWRAVLILAALWMFSGVQVVVGQGVALYVIGKAAAYVQTSTGSPVLRDAEFYPFEAFIGVFGVEEGQYTSVTLTTPDGTVVPLAWSPDDGGWYAAEDLSFQSQTELDAAAPDSTTPYTFSLTPGSGPVISAPLLLSGPNYPNAPHIANYEAAQAIDPSTEFTLFWDAFPGGTVDDFIIVEIRNLSDQTIFSTPLPEMDGVFDGTATSVVIPAGTLNEGRSYSVDFSFFKTVDRQTTPVPGAVGYAVYSTSTDLIVRTTGTAVGPESTSLVFEFFHEPGSMNGNVGSFPESGSAWYTLHFVERGDGDPPENVTFTGPQGSQFESATESESTFGFMSNQSEVNYFSPQRMVAPAPAQFPPGGQYRVSYGSDEFDFQMEDPDAANRVFVAIPTLTVNSANEITAIDWSYAALDGSAQALHPSMHRLHVSVRAKNSDQGEDVPVSVTSLLLATPVPLADLLEIQFVAEDDLGNVYRSSQMPAPSSAPEILVHPQSYTVAPGSSVTFAVQANGDGILEYQWRKDGVDIPGATGSSMTISSVTEADAGAYSVVVSNGQVTISGDGILSVNPTASSKMVNLSNRSTVGTGDEIMIPGFVISGTGMKKVLIRAVGPTLAGFGVSNVLVDPELHLFSEGTEIAGNDNWGSAANVAELSSAVASVGAFELEPASADAAILAELGPGAYTVQASGVGNTTGVALVEIYDVDTASVPSARLVNISNRGFVGSGDAIMIPGVVVGGDSAQTFLIRATGPTLAGFGVEGTLDDPVIRVFNGSEEVAMNDDWWQQSTASEVAAAASQIGAFPLDADSRDAALLITLNPGSYTVQVSGAGNSTGVALLEVYEVP